MYNLGARKFVLFGVQPLGCNPAFQQQNNNTCKADLNYGAVKFSGIMRSSISKLIETMPSAQFVYVNAYNITENIYKNPGSEGFKVVNKACCETNTDFPPGVACVPESKPCGNRDAYMFYDGAHCSTALYRILVEKAFLSQDAMEVYPYNILHLSTI
ncbi:GDSL esterase/lipase At1g29670-like [Nymphaea colorata]|nr:GDSL esterase/lipase At1g29670-like [Nymphaea colorata]